MNNSPSVSSVSSGATSSSKLTNTQNRNKDTVDGFVTINEKVNLTKHQHEVLNIICETYEISLSEYMQQALVEAMRFDIEEGNFSDAMLEKIGAENSKKDNSPSSTTPFAPDLMNSDLNLLKRLQTEVP